MTDSNAFVLKPSKNAPAEALAGLSILVVEDEIFIGMAVEQAIVEAGARSAELATNLQDVEECLAKNSYDAVILDLRLPDGETFDVGTRLLEQGVAVVIHSGHADLDHSQRLPQAVFCPKPSAPRDLVNSIVQAQRMAKMATIFGKAKG